MKNNRKKIPTTVLADIEKFSHDGRGIARIDGKTTFIANALPGERVSFNYIRTKKDYDEGVAQEIIIPSINRVAPKCAHYESCGGCSLQHLSAELQIKEKQDLLIDLLQRIGHCNPDEILPALRAESWHYRNKARLSVRYVTKKKGSLIGFREKINPRYITEIEECPILHRKVGLKLIELRRLIDSLTYPSAIAQIEVAAGDYEVALIFRNLQELTSADQEKLVAFAQENELIIFLQPGNAESVYRIYPQASDDYIHYSLPDENLQFKFHPTDFTQVNAGLNQLMIKQALELLQLNADDVVLDLFCGLGNFSLPIAKKSKQVIGIEGSSAMVARATLNAKLNNIDNVIFYAADLDKPNELQNFQLPAISKMLIDPPRSGALEIVKQIKYLKPSSLVYVSCNPATLARDCDVLVNQLGYRLKAAGVMDMFPHTAHVESIALFEKDS